LGRDLSPRCLWVKALGHHPLVRVPAPEVDVVASSFRVELVTTVTTATGTMTEQTQSYSTAIEGSSTSVAGIPKRE
jgi:hypothetical protein